MVNRGVEGRGRRRLRTRVVEPDGHAGRTWGMDLLTATPANVTRRGLCNPFRELTRALRAPYSWIAFHRRLPGGFQGSFRGKNCVWDWPRPPRPGSSSHARSTLERFLPRGRLSARVRPFRRRPCPGPRSVARHVPAGAQVRFPVVFRTFGVEKSRIGRRYVVKNEAMYRSISARGDPFARFSPSLMPPRAQPRAAGPGGRMPGRRSRDREG